MIISDEMWRKYKNLKQEILDLKQSKKANCASKYFIFTVNTQNYYSSWQITYKDGTQPIISEVLADAIAFLSTPENNSQYLFFYSQYPATVTILSTREIEDIVGIN